MTLKRVISRYRVNAELRIVSRPRERRKKWPGIHCLRMHEKTAILWVNLYRIARNTSEHDKAKTLIKPSCIRKGEFTLKAEQLDAIKCIEDLFLWLPPEFDSAACFQLLMT